jgi:hypothetical protein
MLLYNMQISYFRKKKQETNIFWWKIWCARGSRHAQTRFNIKEEATSEKRKKIKPEWKLQRLCVYFAGISLDFKDASYSLHWSRPRILLTDLYASTSAGATITPFTIAQHSVSFYANVANLATIAHYVASVRKYWPPDSDIYLYTITSSLLVQ